MLLRRVSRYRALQSFSLYRVGVLSSGYLSCTIWSSKRFSNGIETENRPIERKSSWLKSLNRE